MQHLILHNADPEKLSDEIEQHLAEGWELHGNLLLTSYHSESHQILYAQALTNEQDAGEPRTAAEASRALAELLQIPEDQLPPNTAESRAEILKFVRDSLGLASAEEHE